MSTLAPTRARARARPTNRPLNSSAALRRNPLRRGRAQPFPWRWVHRWAGFNTSLRPSELASGAHKPALRPQRGNGCAAAAREKGERAGDGE